MTSTDSRSTMLTPYKGQASRYQNLTGIRLKKNMAANPIRAQAPCFCRYLVEMA